MIDDEDSARQWLMSPDLADQDGIGRIERLIQMLAQENRRQNLVSERSMSQLWVRHIVDSAQLLKHVPRGTNGGWLDLGTGAGFPGMVVAALRPDMPITVVESRARRIAWLEQLREALGLTNVEVIGSRLELVPSRAFGVLSARAFAPLSALLNLAERFSTSTSLWLLPKGRSAAQELQELRGWNHAFHVEPSLTDPEAGIVVGKLAGRKG